MLSDKELTQSAAAVARVRELMLENGIGERQLSKKLAELLELGYSQAHRKINYGSEWTIRELETVANHFGETLATLIFGSGADITKSNLTENVVKEDATFVIGEHKLPCTVVIGTPLHNPRKVDYVAVKMDSGWSVTLTDEASNDEPKYRVESLEILVNRPHNLSVAILDDDSNVANNISDYLNEVGFAATAFFEVASVQQVIEGQKFDCFVLDWRLGKTTAEALIQRIRQTMPLVPIFLLTGALASAAGGLSESEVARVIRNFDVNFQEKPIRLPILAAEISKALGVT